LLTTASLITIKPLKSLAAPKKPRPSEMRSRSTRQVQRGNRQSTEDRGTPHQRRHLRIAAFKLKEQLRNNADQYRAALQEGVRLIRNGNVQQEHGRQRQANRYRDASFRVSRNDALQKYRATFDLAARYLYMTAKAYDFETNLSPNDRGSAYGYYDQIIRARTLGEMTDGIPLHPGGGLAGIAAMMNDNFRAIEKPDQPQ
jgi:hypothetical protein